MAPKWNHLSSHLAVSLTTALGRPLALLRGQPLCVLIGADAGDILLPWKEVAMKVLLKINLGSLLQSNKVTEAWTTFTSLQGLAVG